MDDSAEIICSNCGYQDAGNYCSSCGAALHARNPFIPIVEIFAEPFILYGKSLLLLMSPGKFADDVMEGVFTLRYLIKTFVAATAIGAIISSVFGTVSPLPQAPILFEISMLLYFIVFLILYSIPLHIIISSIFASGVKVRESLTIIFVVMIALLPLAMNFMFSFIYGINHDHYDNREFIQVGEQVIRTGFSLLVFLPLARIHEASRFWLLIICQFYYQFYPIMIGYPVAIVMFFVHPG